MSSWPRYGSGQKSFEVTGKLETYRSPKTGLTYCLHCGKLAELCDELNRQENP